MARGQHPVDLVADHQIGIETDQRLTVEFVDRDLLAAGERVARGADEDDRLLPPWLRLDQPRAAGIAHQPQISLPALDRLQHPVGMEIFQPDIGLGMAGHEFLHIPTHVVQAHRINGRHPDAASDLLVERPHLVFKRLVAGDQFATAVKKNLAFFRGSQRPLRPLDELNTQPVFQLAHDWRPIGKYHCPRPPGKNSGGRRCRRRFSGS